MLARTMAERGIDKEHYAWDPRTAALRHGAPRPRLYDRASPTSATRSPSPAPPATQGIDPSGFSARASVRRPRTLQAPAGINERTEPLLRCSVSWIIISSPDA